MSTAVLNTPPIVIDESRRQAIESAQLERLSALLGKLGRANRFYAPRLQAAQLASQGDLASLADFARLPFTTKHELVADQLANAPYGTNLTYPVERYTRLHQTSGTTGRPLRVLDTDDSWDWWARCWADVYRAAGVTAADRVFFAFSFGPFIGFWSAFEGARAAGALALAGGGMSSLQRLHTLIDHEATVVVCTPTYALHLAEVAAAEGIDIANSSVRVTVHAGEPGAGIPSTRARIERLWGAKAFDHAGASEVGAWGFDCEEQSGMHLNEAEFLFEVIDPATGEAATEGELIVTNLGRAGMPVLRYRTGDRVVLDETPCACGRPFRRLAGGVIGRVDDAVIVRGINIFPSAIEGILRRFDEVGEFAVDLRRRSELDVMDIRLEVEADDPATVVAAIDREVQRSLGLRANLEPVSPGTLPRFDLKARRFTDHRNDE